MRFSFILCGWNPDCCNTYFGVIMQVMFVAFSASKPKTQTRNQKYLPLAQVSASFSDGLKVILTVIFLDAFI
jgi:hypothetical protein